MVNKHHHPIIVMKEYNEQFKMLVACKGMNPLKLINVFNFAKDNWTMKQQTLNSLDIERQVLSCNNN